ncbi:PAS domain S-box-containing protein [Daejeonella rubra]|uniref:histidine kinase n=2 Tax=Daejeonella rubra TaxID=990371 RepID=A0A1G9TRY4_9SPHI|nr:PAS domain S-box-containing protein [Daejeonella rubra]
MLSLKNIPVFHFSPAASIILQTDSPDFRIAEVNAAFLQATNTKKADLIGKCIFDVLTPENGDDTSDSRKTLKTTLNQVMLLKKPHKIPLQKYRVFGPGNKGNDDHFWTCDTYPLINEHGIVEYIVHTITEVNDLLVSGESENALNNKLLLDKSFQHPLFNDYPDGIFTLDKQGNFLSVNNVMLDLAECTKEELLKLSFIPFIAEEDLEDAFNYFQQTIKGDIINFDIRVKTRLGKARILNITNIPIVIHKEVIGVYGIAKDITHVKEAEKQLEVYHKRVANILESITDGFFAVDHQWKVTYWNREAERILIKSREEMMDKNLWEKYPEAIPLKFYSEYHKAMNDQVSVHFEEYLPSVDLWCEVSAFPSEDGLSIYFRDISNRKKVENELNLEKEKYRNLFNFSPIPQWVYDVETFRFLDVNNAAIRHYGYTRKEFLSMTIQAITLSDDLGHLKEIIAAKVKAKLFNQEKIRNQKKSGEIIYVNIEANTIQFEGRDARLVIATDITDNIKSEQALKLSEQRFKALVQDGSDLIAILDTDGNYQYVSPTSKSILGIDADSFIGKNAFDFIHKDDKELVKSQFDMLSVQKRVEVSAFRFLDGNNKFRWVETIITDMSDDPVIAGIVANSRDVTRRIEDENKIKAGLERYNIVSKATSDTIYDFNFLTNEVVWNKGIHGIFGHKLVADTTTQEWWLKNVHPEDAKRTVQNFENCIKNKKPRWKAEYRFRSADGTYRYVLDRSFLIYNEEGEPVKMIGAIQDITEQINYIQAIEDQNTRLREIAWFQSHVVRAPLARIMGLTDILKNAEGETYYSELLAHILTSAQELDDVIRSIVMRSAEVENEPAAKIEIDL